MRYLMLAVATASLWSSTACTDTVSNANAPVKVCGQTLHSGPVGLFVHDVWHRNAVPPLDTTIAATPSGKPPAAPVLLKLASGCSHGADLRIAPPGVLDVVAQARAKDGKLVAVSLVGRRQGTATVTVSSEHRSVALNFDVK